MCLGLQESVLHSLLILEMVMFVVELSSADPNLINRLWPREIGDEEFTVFGFSDQEFDTLINQIPRSSVSRTLIGHIIDGKIHSSSLTQGTILTPISGNYSLHVTTVISPLIKVKWTVCLIIV